MQTPKRGAGDEPYDLSQRIQKAKHQLERMLDMNPEGMLLVDPDMRVTRVNRSLLALLGVESFGAVLGKTFSEVFSFPDADLVHALTKSRESVVVREAEVLLGAGRHPILKFTLLNGEDGRVIMVRDVTRERAEWARAEKQHKKQGIRALLGTLMHHINQPLTVMTVKAHLLQERVAAGTATREDILGTIKEITDLSLSVADILKVVESAEDYETEEYIDHFVRDLQILTLPKRAPVR